MVFLDPQSLPERTRRLLTFWTKTDRSRKILGVVWMLIAIFVALDASGLFS